MRRIVFTALALCVVNCVFAQADTVVRRANPAAAARTGSSDHLLFQIGYTTWTGKPDSINTRGFSRSLNGYFMFAFPFKTNPKLAVAIGPGIASDNIFFDETRVGITDNAPTLRFEDRSDTTHFKKTKLTTVYLEAPVELRFNSNPGNPGRGFKFALGAKVGTLLGATVKNKTLQDRNDRTTNSYTEKQKSRRYFNSNRLSVMARVGIGHFTLFTSYAVTPLFKEGQGPQVRPLTIGLTLSGL